MTTDNPIKLDSRWEQVAVVQTPAGPVEHRREIKIIARPTLSAPAGYQVLRNTAHPHRVGKTGSISASRLRKLYAPVGAQ